MDPVLPPNERVLSTLNADGSRRWLDPKPVQGPLRTRRHVLGWVLIVIFVALPHLHHRGEQLFFLNFAEGEFTLFGATFLRTDTLLLALSMLAIGVSIFLLTALFGRVWCGWACPQTVYLEFVFRPLGVLFNGKGKKGLHKAVSSLPSGVRRVLYLGLFLAICFGLANTFLAYFVGSRELLGWITSPPWVHPLGFGFVVFVTAMMIFNFGFFREQLCIIACPYGRMQSVLLDRQSLIVGYDEKRGEPRGKLRRNKKNGDVSLNVVNPKPQGDCVACSRCVQVCPTGIDIREGLQLECIHCARCIDACNEVMAKVGRELGLIRYSSQTALEGGKSRLLRPRVIIYPLLLLGLVGVMAGMIATKSDTDARLVRAQGNPFNVLSSGEVTNQVRVQIANRGDVSRTFFAVALTPGVRAESSEPAVTIPAGESGSLRLLLVTGTELFANGADRVWVELELRDDDGPVQSLRHRMVGPMGPTAPTQATPTIETQAPANPASEGDG